MKAKALSLRKLPAASILLALSEFVFLSMARAQTPDYDSVGYNPPQTQIQINPIQLPYTTTYPLKITAPLTLAGSQTVTLRRMLTTPDSKPASVSEATALSYVTFSGGDLNPDGTLTFSAAGQSKVVQVIVAFPPLTVSGSYGYKLFTDGWPAGFVVATSTNLGSDINASVSVNNVANPPVVVIGNPVDATEYTFSPANSYSVNFDFAANVDGLAASPITTVAADVSTTPGGVGGNVVIGKTAGLNTTSVTGSGTLTVNSPGTYYLTVRATNSVGTATDTNSFVIKVNAPPPVVTITAPANDPDYTYVIGDSPVVVPNSFTGTTGAGTVIKGFGVSLRYPSNSVQPSLSTSNVDGLNSSIATASTPLALSESGQYTLSVTASNQYATSQPATATFWINRVSNPVSQTINAFQSTSFSVTAQGRPSFTYQWYRLRGSAAPELLTNAGPYSGVTTATLSVTGATGGMSGDKYYCMITPVDALGGYRGSIRSADAVLTVNKLPLTVTADNKSKVYGDPMPTFSKTITGFANGQSLATSGVTGEPDYATFATATSPVSAYDITPSLGSLTAENYYFTYAKGTLTVVARPVTATVAVTKVYDGTAAVNFTGANVSPLSNALAGDDVALNLGAASGTYPDKNVGTGKAVTLSGLSLGGTKAGNYSLSGVIATGSITKAVLTFDADDVIKVYGAVVPTLSATPSGFVPGETLATSGVTGTPSLTTTAQQNSPVVDGGYPITAALGSLASNNYSFVFTNGVLTVNPAPLMIKADDKSMTAGQTPPAYTATYIGLVAGDTSAAVTGLKLTCSATSASPAATYTIVVDGGTAANYTITRVNGTLTITSSTGGTKQTVTGMVFLDVNLNWNRDNTDEVGLGGIVVKAYDGSTVKATTTTTATGSYTLSLEAGTYEIDAIEPVGLTPTNPNRRYVTVASSTVAGPDIGLAMNFTALKGLRSDGMSQGYWKNNLSKAISNITKGVQETKANMFAYTTTVGNLGISPFAGLTPSSAMTVFNGTDQLSLQLLAAEYNFVSGRFINSSQPVTYAFIAWGEYVLKYRVNYSATYQTYIKDWMDAFNNGHGTAMTGPSL